MKKELPPARGTFVANHEHPEYGIGLVVAVSVFTMRVLFVHGGLRIMHFARGRSLLRVTPTAEDLDFLVGMQATLCHALDPSAAPRTAVNDDQTRERE